MENKLIKGYIRKNKDKTIKEIFEELTEKEKEGKIKPVEKLILMFIRQNYCKKVDKNE